MKFLALIFSCAIIANANLLANPIDNGIRGCANFPAPKMYSTEIYLESGINWDGQTSGLISDYVQANTWQDVNNILETYALEISLLDPVVNFANNIPTVYGNQNIDKLVKALASNNLFQESFDIHIYGLNNSDFLRFANALAFEHGGEYFIFIDAVMLQAPHLIIHELGHALGLPHSLSKYPCARPNSSYYNFMNPVTLGCPVKIDTNQIILINQNTIRTYANPSTRPDFENNTSLCCRNYLDEAEKVKERIRSDDPNAWRVERWTNLSQYYFRSEEDLVNNIDGHQLSNPLVNDVGNRMKYLIELRDGIHPKVAEVISRNYEVMDTIFNLAQETTSFRDKMMVIHKRLRQNNILRWMKSDVERLNLQQNIQWEFTVRAPQEIDERVKQMCTAGLIICPPGCQSNCLPASLDDLDTFLAPHANN